MTGQEPRSGFLAEPPPTGDVQRLYASDVEGDGYVMNLTRLWAHLPAEHDAFVDLVGRTAAAAGLTVRQRGVLISACASTLGDSYCSLAWGRKLAGEADETVAAAVLRGDDDALDEADRVLARWARAVAGRPNDTSADDVQALRDAGYDDRQIFAITLYLGLRLAFSTVNDALGARPDRELEEAAPAAVREAVAFGRPVA